MFFQAIYYLFVLVVAIYYFTIFLALLGFKIFGNIKIDIGKAIIPFYYWKVKEKKEEEKKEKEDIDESKDIDESNSDKK